MLIPIFFADDKFLACKVDADSYFSITPKSLVEFFYLIELYVIENTCMFGLNVTIYLCHLPTHINFLRELAYSFDTFINFYIK